MIPVKDQYDWLVLGDHPAAMLTAVLASRAGLSALVLNPFPGSRRVYLASAGREFDPEPNHVVGLGESAENSFLLVDNDLRGASFRKLALGASVPHLLTDSERVFLSGDRTIMERELKREFGHHRPEVTELLASLPSDRKAWVHEWFAVPGDLTAKLQTWGSEAFPSWMKTKIQEYKKGTAAAAAPRTDLGNWDASELWPCSPDWKRFCRGIQFSVFQGAPDYVEPWRVREGLMLAGQCGQVEGGIESLRRNLRMVGESWGANFLQDWECKRLFVNQNRLVAVQISKAGESKTKTIEIRGGVLGVSVEHMVGFLEGLRPAERRYQLKSAPPVEGWWFSLMLEVPAEAIPPGATSRMTWVEEQGQPVVVELEPIRSGMNKNPHRYSMYLRTLLPFEPETLDDAYQKNLAGRLLHLAKTQFPFLGDRLLRVIPDFRLDRGAGSAVYGFAAPELIPENLRVYRGKGLGPESGIDGLYVATGEAYPEWGSVGAWISATEALGRFLQPKKNERA